MDRVVIDTNVIVSAALNPEGAPARVVGLFRAGRIELAVSPAILVEYEDVLGRPEFRAVACEFEELLRGMRADALEVVAPLRIDACSHSSDAKFLECAFAAQAGYLITGNLRHFPAEFSGIQVLAPAAYLRRRGA